MKMITPLRLIHGKLLKPGTLYLVSKVCTTPLKFQRIKTP